MSAQALAELRRLRATLASEFPAGDHEQHISARNSTSAGATHEEKVLHSTGCNGNFSAMPTQIKIGRETTQHCEGIDGGCSPFLQGCANVQDDKMLNGIWHGAPQSLDLQEKLTAEILSDQSTVQGDDTYAYYLDGLMGDVLRERIDRKFRLLATMSAQYGGQNEHKECVSPSSASSLSLSPQTFTSDSRGSKSEGKPDSKGENARDYAKYCEVGLVVHEQDASCDAPSFHSRSDQNFRRHGNLQPRSRRVMKTHDECEPYMSGMQQVAQGRQGPANTLKGPSEVTNEPQTGNNKNGRAHFLALAANIRANREALMRGESCP